MRRRVAVRITWWVALLFVIIHTLPRNLAKTDGSFFLFRLGREDLPGKVIFEQVT